MSDFPLDIRTRQPSQRSISIVTFSICAGILVIWWSVSVWWLPSYIMPGPYAVAEQWLQFLTVPNLSQNLLRTLAHVSISVVIACTAGTMLALLAYYFPTTRVSIHGRVAPFLNAFAGIGWAFLAMTWFGLGSETVIFAVVAVLLPFSIINVRTGLETIDTELVEMGKSFGGSYETFRRIVIPALYPSLLASMRISAGVAWKVTLTAEMFGGDSGLGYVVNSARQDFDTARIFAVISMIIVIMLILDWLLFDRAQRLIARQYATQ